MKKMNNQISINENLSTTKSNTTPTPINQNLNGVKNQDTQTKVTNKNSSTMNKHAAQAISNKDLDIIKKYIDLIYYTNNLCVKYPKHEKFSLVSDTKRSLYEGLRNLLYAKKEFYPKNKLNYLNNLDVELNLQKVFIRLAYKYKYISLKNYETWSTLVTEICNMLGGWIKLCQKR